MPPSTEGERKRLDPGIEELDFEGVIRDGTRLANELIETWLGYDAVAFAVRVDPMRISGRVTVQENAKPHATARRRWPHDEMKVTGVETKGDASVGRVRNRGLLAH